MAGLSGRAVDGDEGDLELPHTVTGRTTLTVEGGVAGHTVTGIVVKGGDGYLVHPAAELGELPWDGLVPPLNNGGRLPDISHWFFCVEPDGQPGQPGGEPGPEPEQPGGEPERLSADTGFGSAWLLFAGLGLVALGAVFVASPKLRGLIRR